MCSNTLLTVNCGYIIYSMDNMATNVTFPNSPTYRGGVKKLFMESSQKGVGVYDIPPQKAYLPLPPYEWLP